MKKLLFLVLLIPLLSGCDLFNDKCSETDLEEPISVVINVTIINTSYDALEGIHVYGYKYYCSGGTGATDYAVGDIPTTGGYRNGYLVFKFQNERDEVTVKVVATGVDGAGDEYKRELSIVLTYADFANSPTINKTFKF